MIEEVVDAFSEWHFGSVSKHNAAFTSLAYAYS